MMLLRPGMERFAGQPLGLSPRILVIGTAKLGNYVVLMPLLRALLERYPSAQIIYRGHARTRELELLCPWIHVIVGANSILPQDVDLLVNADGHNPLTAFQAKAACPRYVVGQVDGLAVGNHPLQRLALDPNWADPNLVRNYHGWIATNSIRELHGRCCWLDSQHWEDVILPSEAPPMQIPDLLLAVNAERRAKLWPVQHWLGFVRLLCRTLGLVPNQIGLIGAEPSLCSQLSEGQACEAALVAEGVFDLRGRLSLPQVVGAFAQARLAVCSDSGPLHLAAAVGCPTVAIFGTDAEGLGASPRELWRPRGERIACTVSSYSCNGCQKQSYRNDLCSVMGHGCLTTIGPEQVIQLAVKLWR